MNKKISSHLAILSIVILAIAVSLYTWIKSNSLSFPDETSQPSNLALEKQKENSCKSRAFQGSANVRVWQTTKNEKVVLEVASEDVKKLPIDTAKDFQLIDPTPEVQKKLASSSEEKPIEIEISGFATLCNGMYLASMDYKDGIFKPYIVN